MVRVLAVNNYPSRERFRRVVKCLEGNGAEVVSIDFDQASSNRFGGFAGAVLSGSPDMMSDPKTASKFRRELDAVVDSEAPVLGICFGHQLMARAFGADVVEDGKAVLGMVETEVLQEDPLFGGLPRALMLLESRHEVVKSLPEGFGLLARSATTRVAAMKHGTRPLYGVQFHPERFTRASPEGNRVVANFLALLR